MKSRTQLVTRKKGWYLP